jgi:hypothetical protein
MHGQQLIQYRMYQHVVNQGQPPPISPLG